MKQFSNSFFIFILAVIAINMNVTAQRITVTLAGTGAAGFTPDGKPGRYSVASGPKDVCMDAAQNIYFVERANGLVRKLSANKGVITTIAGGGTSLADGIPATNAIIAPNYMCINSAGDIFITTGNQVKKVSMTTGNIYTVAGSSVSGYSGDGGPATAATLNYPQGLAADVSDNILVVDRNNNCIRKIDNITGLISTFIGTGGSGYSGDGGPASVAMLNAPVCVAVSPMGDYFISDQNPSYPAYDNSIIRRIYNSTNYITTIAGSSPGSYTYGVPALLATLGTITGLCTDNTGNIYCNEMSCSDRELDMTNDTLYLEGGNFAIQGFSDFLSSGLSNMDHPFGLCMDTHSAIIVADSANNRIRKLIQLTTTPTFAFNHGQSIQMCEGHIVSLDTQMAITDLDSGQAETWTVVSAPAGGTLMGFPVNAISNGTTMVTMPTGTYYSPLASFTGYDSFQVQVSDGTLSDTTTIYVAVNVGCPTSVAQYGKEATHLNIYPNPATSSLFVEWQNGQVQNTKISIIDAMGKEFINFPISFYYPAVSLDISYVLIDIYSLPSGLYFVKVNNEVRKFLK